MYAKRRVTGATSRSFGHEDTFGKFVDDGLENKVCIPLDDAGGWAEGPKLWTLEQVGPLPPGALAYVRVKAATKCRAGRDLEFHQLAGAVHLSGDTEAWLKKVADGKRPVTSLHSSDRETAADWLREIEKSLNSEPELEKAHTHLLTAHSIATQPRSFFALLCF